MNFSELEFSKLELDQIRRKGPLSQALPPALGPLRTATETDIKLFSYNPNAQNSVGFGGFNNDVYSHGFSKTADINTNRRFRELYMPDLRHNFCRPYFVDQFVRQWVNSTGGGGNNGG